MGNSIFHAVLSMLIGVSLHVGGIAIAQDVSSFTEPHKRLRISSTATAKIESIHVQEGQRVVKGQLLAELDCRVLQAALSVAIEKSKAMGNLKSAKAEHDYESRRLSQLETLKERGHAGQEEIERAKQTLELAAAALETANDSLRILRLEQMRIEQQIEQLKIYAPIDGVITAIEKDEGELITPYESEFAEIVQVDNLRAEFAVPVSYISGYQTNSEVSLRFDSIPLPVAGIVEFVSPITEAQTNTVRVKIRIPNPQGIYRAGTPCKLEIRDPEQVEGSSQTVTP
ncbi:MAG: efflux RND transporter periplasmic adaptor subunit [Planctomycetota bacterium]